MRIFFMRIFFPTRKAARKKRHATSCRSFHTYRKGRIIGTTSGVALIMREQTSDGRPIRIVTILEEYSRECLNVHIHRQVKVTDVIGELSDLFVEHGASDYLRSDNGPEFTADVARQWLGSAPRFLVQFGW